MYLILNQFKNKICSYLKKVIVIIEYYQLHKGLKVKNLLSTPKFIGNLKVLCKYLFILNYVLQSPVVKKNYFYKGNMKMVEHERDTLKHLQYFLTKGVGKNGTKKSNLPKKLITNKPKIKNKIVNKLEITVKLHENPIKNKIKTLVAGGVEVDACSAKCQW